MKTVRIRPRADAEIDSLADYIAHDSFDAAMRFLDAIQKTFDLIDEQSGIGPLLYAHLPMLEGLRVSLVSGFENHLVFYIERLGYIDVLRVLHGARDIPAALKDGC
jgi:toxin ParE1/3/4